MRRLGFVTATLACCLAGSAQSGLDPYDARRVALVVGEAAYDSLPKLQNTVRDAEAMTAALQQAGFEVTRLINAGRSDLTRALKEFGEIEKVGVKLIYYAGTGFRLKGAGFLAPVDATVKGLDDDGVSLDRFVAAARGGVRLSAIIIDACLQETRGEPDSAPGEFRMPGNERNEVIALAACGSGLAQDGPPGGHSPYAAALLRHLFEPGVSIWAGLIETHRDVVEATAGAQRPCVWATGGEDVSLGSPPRRGLVPADNTR